MNKYNKRFSFDALTRNGIYLSIYIWIYTLVYYIFAIVFLLKHMRSFMFVRTYLLCVNLFLQLM